MPLKIMDIDRIMEEHAPARFKESYDNVGLMIGDKSSEVTSILISLDCTLNVIEEAKRKKCNLILTHHPLLFKKPNNITTDTLLGKKIIEIIKSEINVYSSHTNLDSVAGGINDIIMQLLGFNNYKTIELSDARRDNDFSTGIGRIAVLEEPIMLSDVCDRIKQSLGIPLLRYSGNDIKKVKKVAVINGSGQGYFNAAIRLGADCIITGDTTYHYVSDLLEEGIPVIDAGHFGTEWPAMKILAKWLKNTLEDMGFNNPVHISELNKNPYKYK
ncbi:Nif3-like dinuclear metal center hexameric protein [Clostridium thailandense]|uniref:GTP cyclohydrolase 1 type 2 homolog n=1 Tax=Clostridium thailandense TaxID=2794346 RepID=A0A949TV63_9CLOT|nr:Nif3-like dinuclear metal center hexameric protein [Clostridium thailandense]MBV7273008.1 Nif3-like dinuclear metal center hexameric protein [Clostridium thailandense]MCH5135672.1 Nif3-like dinuclear metal center hexameric protein [Clostridiaceae bacterium UIB06]